MISVPGALALSLPQDLALGPVAAFMVGTEFAHLHPVPDYSLHLVLPAAAAEAAIDAGWAEQHPIARLGIISPGAVMVYAPRDAHEADIAAGLVRASYAYATGSELPLRAGEHGGH
ncbi:luciferase family protein [Demequina sp.]|uniref:luciferase domain-containing protein n=1 Tax=Demequina sp. TaxID=2050685 RepID=UPI003450773F